MGFGLRGWGFASGFFSLKLVALTKYVYRCTSRRVEASIYIYI